MKNHYTVWDRYSAWAKVRLVILIFLFLPISNWPPDFQTYSINFFTNKVTFLQTK